MLQSNGGRTWRSCKRVIPEAALQQVAELASEPGVHHAYHNANYMLLADIVERVSGESFAGYLDHHVFVPLALRSARAVSWMDEAADRVPRGHVFLLGNPLAVGAPQFFVGGAGGRHRQCGRSQPLVGTVRTRWQE